MSDSPENRAVADLGAACDRFVRRGDGLRECDVEALRTELMEAMADVCEEIAVLPCPPCTLAPEKGEA